MTPSEPEKSLAVIAAYASRFGEDEGRALLAASILDALCDIDGDEGALAGQVVDAIAIVRFYRFYWKMKSLESGEK